MCAAVLNDSEKKRFVDRIRAVMFHEARDVGASFISQSSVALWLGRSVKPLSSIIGTRVWTTVKLSLQVAGRKCCLRSRRTLSLRDPAIERKAAHNLAKKSNNIMGKLGVGKLFTCFVKDMSWRLGMRFQSLVKPNWILKIASGLWIPWESGTKAASSIQQWVINFSLISQGDPIFRMTESGNWLRMRFQRKSIIVNWSKVLNVLVFLSSSLRGRWCEW